MGNDDAVVGVGAEEGGGEGVQHGLEGDVAVVCGGVWKVRQKGSAQPAQVAGEPDDVGVELEVLEQVLEAGVARGVGVCLYIALLARVRLVEEKTHEAREGGEGLSGGLDRVVDAEDGVVDEGEARLEHVGHVEVIIGGSSTTGGKHGIARRRRESKQREDQVRAQEAAHALVQLERVVCFERRKVERKGRGQNLAVARVSLCFACLRRRRQRQHRRERRDDNVKHIHRGHFFIANPHQKPHGVYIDTCFFGPARAGPGISPARCKYGPV